jgi:hypothetical protein
MPDECETQPAEEEMETPYDEAVNEDPVFVGDESILEPEPELSGDEAIANEDRDPVPTAVEMRVSSCHLRLASPHFKNLITGEWKESKAMQTQRCLRLEERDWDADALEILMNIIHNRARRVPRLINLEMLAKLAVLVDYYECLEVVEVFSPDWIAHLKQKEPMPYSRDTVLWIWISIGFRQSDLFHTATSAALRHSGDPIQTMGLPIPEEVIRKLFLLL